MGLRSVNVASHVRGPHGHDEAWSHWPVSWDGLKTHFWVTKTTIGCVGGCWTGLRCLVSDQTHCCWTRSAANWAVVESRVKQRTPSARRDSITCWKLNVSRLTVSLRLSLREYSIHCSFHYSPCVAFDYPLPEDQKPKPMTRPLSIRLCSLRVISDYIAATHRVVIL